MSSDNRMDRAKEQAEPVKQKNLELEWQEQDPAEPVRPLDTPPVNDPDSGDSPHKTPGRP